MPIDHRGPARPSARISGPAELLQAIPYLLGFHPSDSLVLVGLRGRRLVVTARLDLADSTQPGVTAHTVAAISRGGATVVVGVVYDREPEVTPRPWGGLAAVLADDAEEHGCELADLLLVSGRHWWSLLCTEPTCCPPEGLDLPDAPSEFAATATVEGIVALPDRAAVEAVLEPAPAAVLAALEPLIEQFEHAAVAEVLAGHSTRSTRSLIRSLFAAARAAEAPAWNPPNDATVARFGVALGSIPIRDAVWMAIDDRRLTGRALWRDLACRLPSPYDAPPLFLFGWSAWRAGDGTLANIAAARAVDSDPGYSAADLLSGALANGVDPRRLPKLRARRRADSPAAQATVAVSATRTKT